MGDLPFVLPVRQQVNRVGRAPSPELQEKLACVSSGLVSLERLCLSPKVPLAQNRLFFSILVSRTLIDRPRGGHNGLAGQSFCFQTFPIVVKCLLVKRVIQSNPFSDRLIERLCWLRVRLSFPDARTRDFWLYDLRGAGSDTKCLRLVQAPAKGSFLCAADSRSRAAARNGAAEAF